MNFFSRFAVDNLERQHHHHHQQQQQQIPAGQVVEEPPAASAVPSALEAAAAPPTTLSSEHHHYHQEEVEIEAGIVGDVQTMDDIKEEETNVVDVEAQSQIQQKQKQTAAGGDVPTRSATNTENTPKTTQWVVRLDDNDGHDGHLDNLGIASPSPLAVRRPYKKRHQRSTNVSTANITTTTTTTTIAATTTATNNEVRVPPLAPPPPPPPPPVSEIHVLVDDEDRIIQQTMSSLASPLSTTGEGTHEVEAEAAVTDAGVGAGADRKNTETVTVAETTEAAVTGLAGRNIDHVDNTSSENSSNGNIDRDTGGINVSLMEEGKDDPNLDNNNNLHDVEEEEDDDDESMVKILPVKLDYHDEKDTDHNKEEQFDNPNMEEGASSIPQQSEQEQEQPKRKKNRITSWFNLQNFKGRSKDDTADVAVAPPPSAFLAGHDGDAGADPSSSANAANHDDEAVYTSSSTLNTDTVNVPSDEFRNAEDTAPQQPQKQQRQHDNHDDGAVVASFVVSDMETMMNVTPSDEFRNVEGRGGGGRGETESQAKVDGAEQPSPYRYLYGSSSSSSSSSDDDGHDDNDDESDGRSNPQSSPDSNYKKHSKTKKKNQSCSDDNNNDMIVQSMTADTELTMTTATVEDDDTNYNYHQTDHRLVNYDVVDSSKDDDDDDDDDADEREDDDALQALEAFVNTAKDASPNTSSKLVKQLTRLDPVLTPLCDKSRVRTPQDILSRGTHAGFHDDSDDMSRSPCSSPEASSPPSAGNTPDAAAAALVDALAVTGIPLNAVQSLKTDPQLQQGTKEKLSEENVAQQTPQDQANTPGMSQSDQDVSESSSGSDDRNISDKSAASEWGDIARPPSEERLDYAADIVDDYSTESPDEHDRRNDDSNDDDDDIVSSVGGEFRALIASATSMPTPATTPMNSQSSKSPPVFTLQSHGQNFSLLQSHGEEDDHGVQTQKQLDVPTMITPEDTDDEEHGGQVKSLSDARSSEDKICPPSQPSTGYLRSPDPGLRNQPTVTSSTFLSPNVANETTETVDLTAPTPLVSNVATQHSDLTKNATSNASKPIKGSVKVVKSPADELKQSDYVQLVTNTSVSSITPQKTNTSKGILSSPVFSVSSGCPDDMPPLEDGADMQFSIVPDTPPSPRITEWIDPVSPVAFPTRNQDVIMWHVAEMATTVRSTDTPERLASSSKLRRSLSFDSSPPVMDEAKRLLSSGMMSTETPLRPKKVYDDMNVSYAVTTSGGLQKSVSQTPRDSPLPEPRKSIFDWLMPRRSLQAWHPWHHHESTPTSLPSILGGACELDASNNSNDHSVSDLESPNMMTPVVDYKKFDFSEEESTIHSQEEVPQGQNKVDSQSDSPASSVDCDADILSSQASEMIGSTVIDDKQVAETKSPHSRPEDIVFMESINQSMLTVKSGKNVYASPCSQSLLAASVGCPTDEDNSPKNQEAKATIDLSVGDTDRIEQNRENSPSQSTQPSLDRCPTDEGSALIECDVPARSQSFFSGSIRFPTDEDRSHVPNTARLEANSQKTHLFKVHHSTDNTVSDEISPENMVAVKKLQGRQRYRANRYALTPLPEDEQLLCELPTASMDDKSYEATRSTVARNSFCSRRCMVICLVLVAAAATVAVALFLTGMFERDTSASDGKLPLPTEAPTFVLPPTEAPSRSPTMSPTVQTAKPSIESTSPPTADDQVLWNRIETGESIWRTFLGEQGIDTPRWFLGGPDSNPTGIRLNIENAADEEYAAVLDEVVADFSASPAVISLNVTTVPNDILCRPEAGKIKVCSGDFGPTQWASTSVLLLRDNLIVGAILQINSGSVPPPTQSFLQYSMCHHFGHTLGIPHQRETMSCMSDLRIDVQTSITNGHQTLIPESWQHPNENDLEKLVDMYGPAPTRRRNNRQLRRRMT